MSRRLANVEDRFALQMLGADLVRDHDRPSSNPSGACRHGPGSASSSGWLAPPASRWVVRTRPACRRWSARSLRTGRFAAARGGVPTCVCSGVAWVSPRFWSPGRGDTLESAASDAVERLFRTSRKSAPTLRTPTSRYGARPPDAPWRRPTDQTSTLESPANGSRRMQSGRSERQHRPASQLPHECRSAGRTMDATDTAAPEIRYCGRSQALLYND